MNNTTDPETFECLGCKRLIGIPFGKESEWFTIRCPHCGYEHEVMLEPLDNH